ncbi:hypothetical protein [Saccharothrix longispora]|uniref:hypothetical protein n=1 Tax=Saccharothrix longispora TaxID=33920 RepID=UPI0028FD37EB|nr:hypothetical protein [Saccharothrix longispora]MDU0292368.1 hypothetical protein [Saccharothrix longispora]
MAAPANTGPANTGSPNTGHSNRVTAVALADGFVDTTVVTDAVEHPVPGRTIVLNLAHTPALVGEPPTRPLPPFSSTVLVDSSVRHAERVALLRIPEDVGDDIPAITGAPGWQHFADVLAGFPRTTGLYRGPRAVVGTTAFDAPQVLGEEATGGVGSFEIRVNLWFAPAGTDCSIHDRHDFIEIHTQVHGYGRMQKFRADDHSTLYEDQLMGPGHTPPVPFCRTRPDGGFTYPWHQYRADTDCVWLAVEYHRTGG